MAKALVAYYSRSGNTRKMAQLIAESLRNEGVETVLKEIEQVAVDELLGFDALAFGTPTYYGSMAAQIKKLFDDSVKLHGKLDGKVGAAFSSSVNVGGGNETAILDILNAMLIHGMILQGDFQGDHYGAVSLGQPDSRAAKNCVRMGMRIAALLKKLGR
jgi:NAD(P)H dehydrogenase (quinone)